MENVKNNENKSSSSAENLKAGTNTRRMLRVSDILFGLVKHFRLIILCAVIGLALGIVLSIVSYMRGEMSKQYAITTTIGIVSQNKDGIFVSSTRNPSNTDFHLAEDMVDAVIYILKSDKMMSEVVDKVELLGVSTRDIASNLALSQYNKTQIINVTLYWRTAQEGVEILKAFNKAAPGVLIDALKIGNVTVINEPTARYLIGGNLKVALWGYMMAVGLMMGLAISILSLLIRPTLLNPIDIERDFHTEILGEIPEKKKMFAQKRDMINGSEDDGLYMDVLDNFMAVAQIVKKRIENLEHPCIYVTAPGLNEGKTTATAYLAVDLARLGLRVLVIDLDTGNPKLGGLFMDRVEYEKSINALYRGESNLEESITSLTGKLDILPAVLERKPLPYDESLISIVDGLKKEYDLVLIDTPPIGLVADTMSLNMLAEYCLLVVRFDTSGLDVIRESVNRLEKSGIRIMGCIVNGVKNLTGRGLDDNGRLGRQALRVKTRRKTDKSIRQQEWEEWEKNHSDQVEDDELNDGTSDIETMYDEMSDQADNEGGK